MWMHRWGPSSSQFVPAVKSGRLSSEIFVVKIVTQGSVLGPVLFNLFAADLFLVSIPGCFTHQYTDGTQLYTICDAINASTRLDVKASNLALKRLRLWFESNSLVLNAFKSAVMWVGSNELCASFLCITNLGEMLDCNLTSHLSQ